MKKQKYRLQPLLNLKARAKKAAEIALAKAIIRLEKEKEKKKKLEEEKEEIIKRKKEAREEMMRKIASGASKVKDNNVHVNFIRKLEEDREKKEKEIKEQEEVIAQAEKDVSRARRNYIDASKELKVMEKHKELWQKKILKEISMREEREMDELGNIIHQLRAMQ